MKHIRTRNRATLGAGLLTALALMPAAMPAAGQDPSGSPTPSAEVSQAPTGSPAPSLPPRPPLPEGLLELPEQGGLLEPGTYGSWALGPLVRFTIPDGWAARAADVMGLGWEIIQLPGGAPAALSMTPFTGEVFADPCLTTSEETIDIEASPAGLVGELTANPNLFAGEPTEVEVAGHPGLQVDVTTQQPMVCDPPVTALWSIPDRGLFMLETGQEARFIPLEVDGQVLVLVIEAFPGAEYEAFLASASQVIETIEIDTAAVAPSLAPSTAP